MLLLLVIAIAYVAGDNMKQRPVQTHRTHDSPTLPHLRNFSVGDKKVIDVVTEIAHAGQDYIKFGHCILKDATETKLVAFKRANVMMPTML